MIASVALAADPPKPNILLIVADDLGWGELGCQGNKEIATPNIDALAREGVRFTNGYVSCPVCSPTRAGLLTGRYQQRFGHEHNPGPENKSPANFALPQNERLLPELLKEGGYATGMVGKWHLGYRSGSRPLDRGFDEFFGFLGGGHSYYVKEIDKVNALYKGRDAVTEEEYLTDAFAREACKFIDAQKDKPFFLYLPFNAVHAPLDAPPEGEAKFADLPEGKRRTFAAMLASLDAAVGKVIAKLDEARLGERTLVFFISDNGGPTPSTTSGNGPLRGYKAQLWEGGIRVPFIVRWKGRIPPGREASQPVISLDIAATALAAAGVAPPKLKPLDGADLMPILMGTEATPPHEYLCWRFGDQLAIRKGDWKLVRPQIGKRPFLYNLRDDIGETKDLADERQEIWNELVADYKQWNRPMMQPRWGAQGAKIARPNRKNANKEGAAAGKQDKPSEEKKADAPANAENEKEKEKEKE